MPLQYTELDPGQPLIRVLRVCPPPAHDAHPGLSCSLEIINLNDRPNFIALSYVWGDPTKTKTLHVDGVAVEATQNLHDALLWYRHHRPDTPIWADAICINQVDLTEKSHQIGQISRVYQEAHRVICWLGPSTPRMDKYSVWGLRLSRHRRLPGAIDAPRKAAWHAAFVVRSWIRGESRLDRVLESLQMATGQNEFFQLSYFQRMWTFQESFLPRQRTRFVLGGALIKYTPRNPKTFYLGHKVINTALELFRGSADGLQPLEVRILDESSHSAFSLQPSVDIQVMAMTRVVANSGVENGSALCVLIPATTDRACYDPRDKIFALLGMLRSPPTPTMEAMQGFLAVDYSKSYAAVVRDALYYIYHCEDKSGFIDICAQLHLHHDSQLGNVPSVQSGHCPSWLPDLTARRFRYKFGFRPAWEATKSLFEWTNGPCPDGQARDILSIAAYRVARVLLFRRFPETTREILGEFRKMMSGAKKVEARSLQQHIVTSPRSDQDVLSSPESVPPASLPVPYSWAEFLIRLACHENLSQRLEHVLIGDNKQNPLVRDAWNPLQNYRPQQTLNEVQSGSEPVLSRYEQSIVTSLRGQKLAILDNGRFALCNAAVQVGDVAFAAGCYEEFIILRPLEAGDAEVGNAGAGDVLAAVAGLKGEHHTDAPLVRQTFHNMVGWSLIEGLGVGRNFERDYAEQVFAAEPEKVFVV